MAGETFKEKRMFERIPCFLTGEYVTEDKKTVGVTCENISAGGANLVMPEVPEGYKATVKLITKDGKYMPLKGAVRWHKKEADSWRVGFCFDKMLFFPLKTFFDTNLWAVSF